MTLWIGLTGGIGSGKSTVADVFADYGVPVIDTDGIARELTTHHGSAISLLAQHFGNELVDASGSLKRGEMRRLMLENASVRAKLEALLHPLIWAETDRRQRTFQAVYGLVAVPLLAERPIFQKLVSRVLLVDCTESIQIERVMQRSGLSRAEAKALLNTQTTRVHRRRIADDILDNQTDLSDLSIKVGQLHRLYSRLGQLEN